MPLVSRRFWAASRDPSAWPELTLVHTAFSTEERWMSALIWLALRGHGLRTFTFEFAMVKAPLEAHYEAAVPSPSWKKRNEDVAATGAGEQQMLESWGGV